MTMKTLQYTYQEVLIKRREIMLRRLKNCIVFTRKEGGCYYLGTHGSLRFGATRTGSIPCSAKFKEMLLMSMEKQCGFPHCKCQVPLMSQVLKFICPKGLSRERI